MGIDYRWDLAYKTMITDQDTNFVYFSALLKIQHPKFCKELESILNEEAVQYGWLDDTLDIWCRDYMPLQISESEFLHFNYYPDYLLNCLKYRGTITNSIRVEQNLGLKCDNLNLILDGGNIIKTPNAIIVMDKLFKENRLPQATIIELLKEKCHVQDVVQLRWNENIERYGHADGVVRYIGNNTVILTNYHQFKGSKELAKEYYSILSKKFKVEVVDFNENSVDKNSWAYINYLQVGNFILLPIFNIPEDELAYSKFRNLFPSMHIRKIQATEIVKKDGVLNCISWNIKKTAI
jgi:agmatine/peptidylarginine deiminase